MTSTNDEKDVKNNQTVPQKSKIYYIEFYKSLEAGLSSDCDLRGRTKHLCDAWRRIHSLCQHSTSTTHPHLLVWLERHTAKIILQTEWQSSTCKTEHANLTAAINDFITESQAAIADRNGEISLWETQLLQRGEWFKKTLLNPWGNSTLKKLLDPQSGSPSDEEFLEWLKEESGIMIETRLRQLSASKCDDLALSLVSAVMNRFRADMDILSDTDQSNDLKEKSKAVNAQPKFGDILRTEAGFSSDIWEVVVDIEFVLLHKCDKRSRCIELAKQTQLRVCYQLVERLENRLENAPKEKKLWKNAKEVATLIAQVTIARCMVVGRCTDACRSALYWCARALTRLVAEARLVADTVALAAPAATARHLHTLAAAVHAQSTESMKPFVCELYVRALTAGMNELERLKMKTEKEADARLLEQTLSSWFMSLGTLLGGSPRVHCECTLTAFSVHPSSYMYEVIKKAPTLPPLHVDIQEKQEAVTSDFGSWANDSRSQTNFVKTSETLNLKQRQQRSNILSTAILTEGEALGLSPELCQDIAVLLSGPRLKTLSWDMDREALLDNCRHYMERTHGGTRALTTELKYLNLDPREFQHLPEEDDEEENDIFYGIEKGYEHLVEFQEPEEIWENTFSSQEQSQSSYSSSIDSDSSIVKWKKKPKKVIEYFGEDSDPLSLMAEAKRKTKKKERPHSKERSKEGRKKLNVDPLDIREDSQQRDKDKSQSKEKKKEKRVRKKKDKPVANTVSLSNLVGMKVTKAREIGNDSVSMISISDIDNCNDSHEKFSLNSEESEDVVFDGLYSMDELKSPEISTQSDKMGLLKNNEFSVVDGVVSVEKLPTTSYTYKLPTASHITTDNNISDVGYNITDITLQNNDSENKLDCTPSTHVVSPLPLSISNVTEEVKKRITRLIDFRRHKNTFSEMTEHNNVSPISSNNSTHTNISNGINRPENNLQNHITPKVVTIPDIPKVYINKKSIEEPGQPFNRNICHPITQLPQKKYCKTQCVAGLTILNPIVKNMSKVRLKKSFLGYNTLEEKLTDTGQIRKTYSGQPPKAIHSFEPTKPSSVQDFLKELKQSINAGAAINSTKNSLAQTETTRKEVKPMIRVTPVIPVVNKDVIKVPQNMKQTVQERFNSQKKVDNSLNTFSRLSYMHKNRQSDSKLKQVVDALIDIQDKNLNKYSLSKELDQFIDDHKNTKTKYIQSKMNASKAVTVNIPYDNTHVITKPEHLIKPTTQNIKSIPMDLQFLECKEGSRLNFKDIKNENQTKNKHFEKRITCDKIGQTTSSLSEKDQNDLLLLLQQQNKLNTKRNVSENLEGHNIQLSQASCSSNNIFNKHKIHNMSTSMISKDAQFEKSPFIVSNVTNTSTSPKITGSVATRIVSTNSEGHNIHVTHGSCSSNHIFNKPKMDNNTTSIISKDEKIKTLPFKNLNITNPSTNLKIIGSVAKRVVSGKSEGHNIHVTQASCSSNHISNKQKIDNISTFMISKDEQMDKSPFTDSNATNSSANLKLQKTFESNNLVISKTTSTLKYPRSRCKNSEFNHNVKKTEANKDDELSNKKVQNKPSTGNTSTDWESVMNAILAQKTPSRGPNALDVALNKSSFAKAFADSIKVHKIHEEKPKLIDEFCITKSDSKQNIKSATKPSYSGKDRIHNTSKPHKHEFKRDCATSKHGSEANVNKHKIPKNSPNTIEILNSNSNLGSLQNSSDIPNSIGLNKKTSHVGTSKRLSSDVQKQFTCPLPQEDDPFISGIANSDYDLLEELMDDDLRQEIGELSSDDDNFNASTQNPLRKNNVDSEKHTNDIFNKISDSIIITKPDMPIVPNLPQPKKTIARVPILKCDNGVGNTYTTTQVEELLEERSDTPKVFIDVNLRESDPANYSITVNKRNNIKNNFNNNVVDESIIATTNSPNMFISTVAPQVFENLMFIDPGITFKPCSTLQTSIQSGVNNLPPNPYIELDKTSNVSLYQTTPFVSPSVDSLKVENTVTSPTVSQDIPKLIPESLIPPKIESSTQLDVTTMLNPTMSDIVRVNKNELCHFKSEFSLNMDNQLNETTNKKNHTQFNLDKLKNNNERKVLSEVQEKQNFVFEKKDQNNSKNTRASFDNDFNKLNDPERLKMKRLYIMNRKIHHYSSDKPIPLAYTPLQLNVPNYSQVEQKQNKEGKKSNQNTDHSNTAQRLESLLNLKIQKAKNETEKSTISKENKSETINCRRILLRSSNKSDLRSTIRNTDAITSRVKIKISSSICNDTDVDNDETRGRKRISKKAVNGAAKKPKEIVKKVSTVIKRITRKKRSKVHTGIKLNYKCEQPSTNLTYVAPVDLEEQILGSKILKNDTSEPIVESMANVTQDTPGNTEGCVENTHSIVQQNQCYNDKAYKFDKQAASDMIEIIDLELTNNKRTTEKTIEKNCITPEPKSNGNNHTCETKIIEKYQDLIDLTFENKEPIRSDNFTPAKDLNKGDLQEKENLICDQLQIKKHNVVNNTKVQNVKSINKHDSKFTSTNVTGKNVSDIPQSYKDSIKIIPLPSDTNDPLRKFARIKLPNGRTFKATTYGRVDVDFDTLFANPSLKSVLLGGLTDKTRYTLNIKQVATTTIDNPNKILETRIQEINLEAKVSTEPIDIIDLLSDDEDNVTNQRFKTEFGDFRIRPLQNNIFGLHQKKFNQNCQVRLISFKTKKNAPELKIIDSSYAKMNNLEDKLKQVQSVNVTNEKNLTNISKTPPQIDEIIKNMETIIGNNSDIIEISDVSNHASIGTVSKMSKEITTLKDEINEQVLLKTEVDTLNIKQSISDNHHSKTSSSKTLGDSDLGTISLTLIPKYSNCYVKLINCDDFVKKYEKIKIMKQKCFIGLVKCDAMAHISMRSSKKNTKKEGIDILEEQVQTNSRYQHVLSKTNSHCSLQDSKVDNIPKVPVLLHKSGRSSPVMNIFEKIALRNSVRKDAISLIQPISVYTCVSEWFISKLQLSSQSKVNKFINNQISDSRNPDLRSFNNVPKLTRLMTEYFQNNRIVYQMKYLSAQKKNQGLNHSQNLKRKLSTDGDVDSGRKMSKVDKVLSLKKDEQDKNNTIEVTKFKDDVVDFEMKSNKSFDYLSMYCDESDVASNISESILGGITEQANLFDSPIFYEENDIILNEHKSELLQTNEDHIIHSEGYSNEHNTDKHIIDNSCNTGLVFQHELSRASVDPVRIFVNGLDVHNMSKGIINKVITEEPKELGFLDSDSIKIETNKILINGEDVKCIESASKVTRMVEKMVTEIQINCHNKVSVEENVEINEHNQIDEIHDKTIKKDNKKRVQDLADTQLPQDNCGNIREERNAILSGQNKVKVEGNDWNNKLDHIEEIDDSVTKKNNNTSVKDLTEIPLTLDNWVDSRDERVAILTCNKIKSEEKYENNKHDQTDEIHYTTTKKYTKTNDQDLSDAQFPQDIWINSKDERRAEILSNITSNKAESTTANLNVLLSEVGPIISEKSKGEQNKQISESNCDTTSELRNTHFKHSDKLISFGSNVREDLFTFNKVQVPKITDAHSTENLSKSNNDPVSPVLKIVVIEDRGEIVEIDGENLLLEEGDRSMPIKKNWDHEYTAMYVTAEHVNKVEISKSVTQTVEQNSLFVINDNMILTADKCNNLTETVVDMHSHKILYEDYIKDEFTPNYEEISSIENIGEPDFVKKNDTDEAVYIVVQEKDHENYCKSYNYRKDSNTNVSNSVDSNKHSAAMTKRVKIKCLNTNLSNVPINTKSSTCTDNKISTLDNVKQIFQIHDEKSLEDDSQELKVLKPKVTYIRKINNNQDYSNERSRKGILKRKIGMKDIKIIEKRYRKGRHIDHPQFTQISFTDTLYSREFVRLCNYLSSVKFSYSQTFHKEHIDVPKMLTGWPINDSCSQMTEVDKNIDDVLFVDLENIELSKTTDPFEKTLAEELNSNYEENKYTVRGINETNFNMGFGEGSGRVIQNLEDGECLKFSAATLSDVKQNQPFLLSEDYDDCVQDTNYATNATNTDDQLDKIRHYFSYIQLKDKVQAFFRKTTTEFNLMKDRNSKSKKDEDFYDTTIFPFGLTHPDFVDPAPVEAIVHVVQVGQLPVSAAAQNPVTCDPRVTQVSDASPPQCSENCLNDDSQTPIKTEYTELTTADLSLPLLQEYVAHNHHAIESQESSNIPVSSENIPIETEIKSVVKIELMEELSQEKIDHDESPDNCKSPESNKEMLENVDYTFDTNSMNALEPDPPNIQNVYNSEEKECNVAEEFLERKLKNVPSEKTDQIAHAMNAAGISTTSEPVVNHRAHTLVNIIPENTQPSANNYSKVMSNALSLQQALAHILPPVLNQNGENNQSSNIPVTPQVLHIVQGKNSTGNHITLVDNSQQSIINTPNSTPVLHFVQNKSTSASSNTNGNVQPNSFSGLSLVDTGLQQGGNQLLQIVNTGNQKNNNTGPLLKRVNLLTNLTNVQGSNEQKMVQFLCKSADGKPIQLNGPHQRSMVLRIQPVESPNIQANATKSHETHDLSPTTPNLGNHTPNKEGVSQQEIKSRSVYEENYAKFIQNSSTKQVVPEKATSLPKFNQAFGKQGGYQDGGQKQNEITVANSHLPSINTSNENEDCSTSENTINLDHIGPITSPPLLLRKPTAQTTQPQSNFVQQIKQTIAPMNIQSMHGSVIYRQIPVNLSSGQTINLITVPNTELPDDPNQKQQSDGKYMNQNEIEQSIIKIVPQSQPVPNVEVQQEENTSHINVNSENIPTPQQPVLTQMRIKLPMLSKTPQMVAGARLVRPSIFQIQRNVIGANQQVYQQLVLTAAPPLGHQTAIRLPQTQNTRLLKVPTESPTSSESQMSSSTLEQLREFDLVLEQVKERSTVQPNGNTTVPFSKLHTINDTTDGAAAISTVITEPTQQVLYSISNNQPLNMTYVNRKSTVPTSTTSTFVRSPDSSGIVDSPPSSSHAQIPHTVTSESIPNDTPVHHKPTKSSKSKPRPKASSNPPSTLKFNTVPPKTSTQKPLEDEQTTQRILYILAEYKEQVENSPDKDKPAPRRRTNLPPNAGSSKRKKSSGNCRRQGGRDLSPVHGDDTCRTMGSEDSSCGTSQGDCNDCLENHSPQDSPRKVVRKLSFDQETPLNLQRQIPQRNLIVADGQTITVARGTTGKPTTAVLMPANYILPVSMVKGGQQIAIVTNRGPKLLTVTSGEGGTTNALLLQRLITPTGLKPVLTRPGVRHVRLPAAALHSLQAFNLAPMTTIHQPDSTLSPAPAPTPPELVDTRANSSPWTERDSQEVKPERDSSPEGSEPWNLPTSADPNDYSYEETVRTDNMDRTVLDPIPDRYSPDMEAQRIFDKMFDVDSKKSYMIDSQADSPRCGYDIDTSDCDDKAYHQIVHKKEGTLHRQHRLTHVSAAALRHKYAILEHELRLQKSLSEECEDLGVDSPSASELFPEAELLFAASPSHDHTQDQGHQSNSHTPQPTHSSIPQPDIDDQIATDQLLPREDLNERQDLQLGLEDVGIVTVSEDGLQTTIALDHEEFARSHPNTTFHSEPTDEHEMQPFSITGIKGSHITSTIFHSHRPSGSVLMTAPQTTVISQAAGEGSSIQNSVKYSDIENMIDALPNVHTNNLSSVLVKEDGLTRFDSILTDSRELHLSNTASAIVHSTGNVTQVIRRVCYEENKRDRDVRYLMDESNGLIAGDDAKMMAEDSSRDGTMESMPGGMEDDRSSPERHTELFWESNSASERSESRRPLDFSSDSDKCCKSPFDETNSTDSGSVGTHLRLDSVIKEARGIERGLSADCSSADDAHPPLRTYPPKRLYHSVDGELDRSLSGKTGAGDRSPDMSEVRRRASGRGVVKRGCHCCNGSPAPPRPKKSRQKKLISDFATHKLM